MNNHIYKFDNKLWAQKDLSSIDVKATGDLGEIQMLIWCKKLEELGIENAMRVRFVDDITLLPKVLEPGVELKDG